MPALTSVSVILSQQTKLPVLLLEKATCVKSRFQCVSPAGWERSKGTPTEGKREDRGAQDTVEKYSEDMTNVAERSYEKKAALSRSTFCSALTRRHLQASSLANVSPLGLMQTRAAA